MRVKGGTTTRRRHKKIIKRAEGFRGRRKNVFKTAKLAVEKALQYEYRDRRVRKRDFRKLWIMRINAAARQHGLSYSKFIFGLRKAGINLNRMVLADIAMNHQNEFAELVKIASNAD